MFASSMMPLAPWLMLILLGVRMKVAGSSWLSSLLGGNPAQQDLHFDLSNAPPLSKDSHLFPEEYERQMRWGTYRPGSYFGVKARHAESSFFGMAWGSSDTKLLRHSCQAGELQAFGWLEHDGESYGIQEIEDQALRMRLRTIFVKDAAQPESIWHARITTAALAAPAKDAKEQLVSLFVYLGVEADGDFFSEDTPATVPWTQDESSGAWRGSLTVRGRDPLHGPFTANFTFHASADGTNNTAPMKWRRVAAQIPSQPRDGEQQFMTGVWNAPEHLTKYLRKAKKGKSLKVLPDEVPNTPANWWALQLLFRPSRLTSVDVHVTFGQQQPLQLYDVELLAQKASQEFRSRLDKAFPLKAPFDTDDHRTAAAAAVAGLLGGIGSFHGRMLARKETGGDKLHRLPEASLFSGVPARSFFPRGFLWDEGFHSMLLVRWQPRMFLDIFGHWLELQQASGWIPREVALGAEQESRVPWQFLPQDPGVANPPSFLLPFAWLVGIAVDPKSLVADALAERAHLGSGADLRKLVVRFGVAALPRLAAWFGFLDKSQRSSHKAGCYAWAGRSAAHCLSSGLDDYPRGLMVNADECHLDLHAWMMLFAGTLSTLCHQLGKDTLIPDHEGVCQRPDWIGRAKALNTSLHEVFAPEEASAPLADYLGKQPVSKKGRVIVTPPWRTDGRCGPEFPQGGRPGECDPYGGGPCCSPSGWCGGSPDFCDCPGCRRSLTLEQRSDRFSQTQACHSPHIGYVSLFPVMLGLVRWDHPRAESLLKALQPGDSGVAPRGAARLWSPFGIMSLSSGDELFRKGEDYWRGKIWGNLNYLAISALRRQAHLDSSTVELARTAHESLSQGFVSNVLRSLRKQRYFFENFDPANGEGRGTSPFTGWTTLVVLVMSGEHLTVDFPQLLGEAGESLADVGEL